MLAGMLEQLGDRRLYVFRANSIKWNLKLNA
jgi:hypothetical protein